MPELERVLKVHNAYKSTEIIEQEQNFQPYNRFTEKDVILITYGDLLISKDCSPLKTLSDFLNSIASFKEIVNTLHILPFFPYSSDRGFLIVDFKTVNPQLGSWKDIEILGENYQLMFDGVFNHVSPQWRAAYLSIIFPNFCCFAYLPKKRSPYSSTDKYYFQKLSTRNSLLSNWSGRIPMVRFDPTKRLDRSRQNPKPYFAPLRCSLANSIR
jgi:hypothetical protein